MARVKKVTSKKRNKKTFYHALPSLSSTVLMGKLQEGFNTNKSFLNLFLGLLIVLTVGVLVFSYFKKNQPELGPAQQSTISTAQEPQKDVTKDNLPGKYIVKEGDTLFNIAKAYYGDGWKFSELATTNKLADADLLGIGQVLEIPKLESAQANQTGSTLAANSSGTGGAVNETIWGDKITSDTYTVQEGDWLSKIAGRAYGDIFAFDKIAKANDIKNPDLIEPGVVLKIPR